VRAPAWLLACSVPALAAALLAGYASTYHHGRFVSIVNAFTGTSGHPAASAATLAPPNNVTAARLPTLANGGFVNGKDYSEAWAPFAPASPWNTRVSAHPVFATTSAAVIQTEFGGRPQNPKSVRANEPGQYDYNYAQFYATARDPVVVVECTDYCDTGDRGGYPHSIHIPAKLRVPGAWDSPGGYGGDRVFSIVQPDGSVADFAYGKQATGDWGAPGNTTLTVGAAAACGNVYTADGMYGLGTGTTAGGHCSNAGLIRANELVTGRINHALKIILECQGPGAVYPVAANLATDACPAGASGGPALGARIWYDVPDATTNATTSLQPWEKAILNALHDYGGYFMDNSCPKGDGSGRCAVNVSGIGFMLESEEPFFDFNYPGENWNPYAALASQGWTHFTVPNTRADQQRWVGADPWNPVDFLHHMHWLAPCSARGSC
jgi:hypothetical protein